MGDSLKIQCFPGSLSDAVANEVPVAVFPLADDQMFNRKVALEAGLGVDLAPFAKDIAFEDRIGRTAPTPEQGMGRSGEEWMRIPPTGGIPDPSFFWEGPMCLQDEDPRHLVYVYPRGEKRYHTCLRHSWHPLLLHVVMCVVCHTDRCSVYLCS